jgi:predicted nucleic acid-binding protein
MRILVDTGVLLRAFHRASPQHRTILRALGKLRSSGHDLVTTSQNISEFWNVSTRPVTARGGFGVSIANVETRVQVIEQLGTLLHFSQRAYHEWRRLLLLHQISGVAVHDARIVAVNDFKHLPDTDAEWCGLSAIQDHHRNLAEPSHRLMRESCAA